MFLSVIHSVMAAPQTISILFLVFLSNVSVCIGTHFRGGTISWRTETADQNLVIFYFRTGWQYGRGGCDVTPRGQYSTILNGENKWMCTVGCGGIPVDVGDNSYYCTATNPGDDWEQGEKRFSYRFTGTGPFTVGYSGRTWMPLSYGISGDWNLETKIDLRKRSDTGSANSSPVVSSFPVYRFRHGCLVTLQLPVYDEDGDEVRCRWSNGAECGSLCNTVPMLPGATLDQATCQLHLSLTTANGYVAGNTYAASITIEDFPVTGITMGGTSVMTSYALSYVPLQFVFEIEQAGNSCTDSPEFIDSPPDGTAFIVPSGYPWSLDVYVQGKGGSLPASVQASGPRNISVSPLVVDTKGRQLVKVVTLSWQPTTALTGVTMACLIGSDNTGLRTNPLCYTLIAGAADPCISTPCQNGGSCEIQYSNFRCICPAGVTGTYCQTDIDECLSRPCQNGGTCLNKIGNFTCFCPAGFTGATCADVNLCANSPCQGRGLCTSLGNTYVCNCHQGYTGTDCAVDIDDCAGSPCLNGGQCRDTVGDYFCICPPKYSGKRCYIEVDFCSPNPCKNGGACAKQEDSFTCDCLSDFIGLKCELPKAQTCNDGDSYCTCMINGKPARVPVPHTSHAQSIAKDLTAGIIGYPIGLLIGIGSCAIFHYCVRKKVCRDKSRPQRRPASTSSTETLTGRTPSPLTPPIIEPKGFNIYRSGFHDDQIFKTGEKMNVNNYLHEKRDWDC